MLATSNNKVIAKISLTALISATILILLLFFYQFNGPLSNQYEAWSAFGSYISGTVGVLAAFTAVIWLIISVHLQKTELEHLKAELASSAEEQRKQTKIGALSALINSSQQKITSYHNDLLALNAGYMHLPIEVSDQSLHDLINTEWNKLDRYQSEIESYLNSHRD